MAFADREAETSKTDASYFAVANAQRDIGEDDSRRTERAYPVNTDTH
jgi:hypothetical protein